MAIFNPITAVNDINRLSQIVAVLIKHGFGQIVSQISKAETPVGQLVRKLSKENLTPSESNITLAKRLRLVLQDLGPTFIKLGQIMSTRPDLVPFEFTEELKSLQDNVPQFSFEEARNQIESELGDTIEKVFAHFNKEPIGTASIGQVYTAILHTGEDVVVKVQRPNVKQTVESDIDLLYILVKAAEKQIPDLRLIEPVGIVKEFEKAIYKELDYEVELRNAIRFAEAFKFHDQIHIPEVHKKYSTKKVFTMQQIKGVKITEAEKVGADKKELALVALQAILFMVFEQGFFHADPHPGNIFALPNNQISFIDLGMVGRLDQEMRDKIADLVIALANRDPESISRSLMTLGTREKKVDFQKFKGEVAEVLDKIAGLPLKEIQFSEILNDLVGGAKKHRIRIPHDFTLMGKAILTIEGVGRSLDPDLNLEVEAEPYVKKLIKERWSAQKISADFTKRALQMYQWSYDVPVQMLSVLEDIEKGNLKFKTENISQDKNLEVWEDIIGKLTAGLVISSLIISSAIFIISTKGNIFIWEIPVTLFLGIAGYIFAGILGLSMIRSVVKSDKKNRR